MQVADCKRGEAVPTRTISRHYVDLGGRRVHYRRAGSGPVLLMVHQSPRSSSEFEALMLRWAGDFTCIAPDTPGFGQSDPLPTAAPDIADFGEALVALLDVLGIDRALAYGYHSGSIILMAAMHAHPERFAALALGAYTLWTEEESAAFGDAYLPPFRPAPFGEHLTWLWNRVLEQSWFFPWYASDDRHRLGFAHDDVHRVDRVVGDILSAGDAFRIAYRAVLDAPRTLPAGDARLPPVLITAYDGDPLQEHLTRLADLPRGWAAHPVATADAHEAVSRDFLLRHAADVDASPPVRETADAGFLRVSAAGFDGLIHWRGDRAGGRFTLHAPAGSLDLLSAEDGLRIDLPGHGLSEDWPGDAHDIGQWATLARAVLAALRPGPGFTLAGEGESALLALAAAPGSGAASVEGIDACIARDGEAWVEHRWPGFAPDRFGTHLARSWSVARAAACFWPWFQVSAATAIPIAPGALDPERLARVQRSLVRATRAADLGRALLAADRERLVREAPAIGRWSLPGWAEARGDLWRPGLATARAAVSR